MNIDLFRKVLGLLGSDQSGERSAAALRATIMLKESGLNWADVTAGLLSSAAPSHPFLNPDALNRALQEAQSLKSALAAENVRNRILTTRVAALEAEAMRRIDAAVTKAAEQIDPPEKEKSRRSRWSLSARYT